MPRHTLQRELAALMRRADPRALVVAPGLVRRVIKRHLDTGLSIPHDRCYAIDRAALTAIVDPAELDLSGTPLPESVILLAMPEHAPREAALSILWRRLFHARVEAALERHFKQQPNPQASARALIDKIGQVPFDEIRAVLSDEEALLPPADDLRTVVEFSACHLELSRFEPTLLPHIFPSVAGRDDLDALLAGPLDPSAILDDTRPEGAPEPGVTRHGEREAPPLPPTARRTAAAAARILSNAQSAATQGNHARAAIQAHRASHTDDADTAERAQSMVETSIKALIERLSVALPQLDAPEWESALAPLIAPASAGFRAVEARLLFDLQKTCLDWERDSFALDPLGWARSRGQKPLMRRLKGLRQVLRVQHLRRAASRLTELRIAEHHQRRLSTLLRAAEHTAEEALRDRVRPTLTQVLGDVGFEPENLPEAVARDKLVEELLDLLVERGFLKMGDLRDALSRSHLGMPDMAHPRTFIGGDMLLRADAQLSEALDAAWRRGEVYLRMLQRLSALAFGTGLGRWLTLFLALPFGTAFVALSGLEHLIHPIGTRLDWPEVHITGYWPLLGLVVLAFLHSPALRGGALRTAKAARRGIKTALVVWPLRLWRSAPVQRFVTHPWVRALWRFGLKPLVLSAFLWAALPALGVSFEAWGPVGGALFLVVNLIINSRPGRRIEDTVAAWLVGNWRAITDRLLPGLLRLVVETSRRALDRFERVLYSVDERLRFRSTDGAFGRVLKAIAGLVWSAVTYVARIYINLLIEPQINPIKHFPVVTVSHKIILPMTLQLTALMAAPLSFLGPVLSNTIAGATVFLLPGVFGFLVWELKENWRLYAANRPQKLLPAPIGHHGESMVRLLRPGFHSGTVPKLYGRLRRAEREGDWRAARKHERTLHEVEHAVSRFVERELVALIDAAHIAKEGLSVGRVEASSNRISVELRSGGHGGVWLDFEEQSGWVVASARRGGWWGDWPEAAREALEVAMRGLYKRCAASLIREQLRTHLPEGSRYDVADAGLVVWPDPDFQTEITYDLALRPTLTPSPRDEAARWGLRPVEAGEMIFGEIPMPWEDWIGAWRGFSARKTGF